MSSYYCAYTEIKLDDKWQCINQYLPVVDKETGETKWKMIPTEESGSRSYFGETFEKIHELGTWTRPDDLSDTLEKEFPKPQKKEDEPDYLQDYYDGLCHAVLLEDMVRAMPEGNHKQFCGIYHKNDIRAFETHEIEDLYERDVDPEDYAKMAPEMREKLYQYYEWDDPMNWQPYFRDIIKNAYRQINEWEEATGNWFTHPQARIVCFMF